METGKTSSSPDGVLHHPPEAFDGIEVVATMGGQKMEAKFAVVALQGRVELVRPMNPTAIDDHHDLLLGFAKGGHHVMDVLAQFLRIEMGHNFREDFGSAIVDGADNTQQHTAGDAAPRAILQPCLTFETF